MTSKKQQTRQACPFRPLGDKLVIKPEPAADRTKGGIILPDDAQDPPDRGLVVAVGPGRMTDRGMIEPIGVEVGEEVYYFRHAGVTLKVGDQEYLVTTKREICAVIVGGDPGQKGGDRDGYT